MTKNELNMIAKLLQKASESFCNHGCNDYEISNTPENIKLLQDIEEYNVGRTLNKEELDDFLYIIECRKNKATLNTMDWLLMSYFAKKLKEETEK